MLQHLSFPLLRIATLLLLSILSFGFCKAQQVPSPEETKQTQEVADLFLKRFEETGDLAQVIQEFYINDWVERYIKQHQKEVTENKLFSGDLFFAPGLWYRPELLKQATNEDWRLLYAATYNVLFQMQVLILNQMAPDLLNGKDPQTDNLENLIPAKLSSLFNEHPILKNFIRKKAKSVPFSTVEEMRSATVLLKKGAMLQREGNSGKPIGFSKEARQLIALLMKTDFATPVVVPSNEEYFGFPPKTRILFIRTPVGLGLLLTEVKGKTKVIWAEVFAD